MNGWRPDFHGLTSVLAFGVKGDGTTDDTAAFRLAVAAGVPLYIPYGAVCRFRDQEGVVVGSGFELYGPGKIKCDPSQAEGPFRGISVGDPYATDNIDRSNIIIDGVEFESTADREYSTFIMLKNEGGALSNVSIRRCLVSYHPAAKTGADRWFVSFGGGSGDLRSRIDVSHNVCTGPMQLTGNGQDADYEDITLDYNYVIGGVNAGIALSRLSESDIRSTYRRIKARWNYIDSRPGGLGLFMGADGSEGSSAPQLWNDVEWIGNYIKAGHDFPIDAIFRVAEGAESSVAGLKIRGNTFKSSHAGFQFARHTGDAPGSAHCLFTENVVSSSVYTDVGTMETQGNTIAGSIIATSDAIVIEH